MRIYLFFIDCFSTNTFTGYLQRSEGGKHQVPDIKMNPLVKITISLLVETKQDHEVYLAKCPFLNIVTQGPSEPKALENLKEEIYFFVIKDIFRLF